MPIFLMNIAIKVLWGIKKYSTFAPAFSGEMAEWSNAVVLKTIVLQGTGGSNPSLSARLKPNTKVLGFFYVPTPSFAC